MDHDVVEAVLIGRHVEASYELGVELAHESSEEVVEPIRELRRQVGARAHPRILEQVVRQLVEELRLEPRWNGAVARLASLDQVDETELEGGSVAVWQVPAALPAGCLAPRKTVAIASIRQEADPRLVELEHEAHGELTVLDEADPRVERDAGATDAVQAVEAGG